MSMELDDLLDNSSVLADRCLNVLENGLLTTAYGYARTLFKKCYLKNSHEKDKLLMGMLNGIYNNIDNLYMKELREEYPFKRRYLNISLSILQDLFNTGKETGLSLSNRIRHKSDGERFYFKEIVEAVDDFKIFLIDLINDVSSRNKIEFPKFEKQEPDQSVR